MDYKLLLCFVIAAVTIGQVLGQMAEPKELIECQKELKVTGVAVLEYLQKDALTSTNANMRCLFKCLGEKFGIFKDGKLVESKVLADIKTNSKNNATMFQKEMQIFNDCKGTKGKDACDTATAIYRCVKSGASKLNM